MDLSPTKSMVVVVLFIKSKLANINFPGKLQVNGKEIVYSHQAWYLGVQLDRKLISGYVKEPSASFCNWTTF